MSTQNQAQPSNTQTEEIDPRCVVKFRPADDWEGEYGFDWYREKDYRELTVDGQRGDHPLKNIFGITKKDHNGNPIIVESETHYDNIVGKYRGEIPVCLMNRGPKLLKKYFTDTSGNILYRYTDPTNNNYYCWVSKNDCSSCNVNSCPAKSSGFFSNSVIKEIDTNITKEEKPKPLDPDNFLLKYLYFDVHELDEYGNILISNHCIDELKKHYNTITILPNQEYIIPYISLFYNNKRGKTEAEIKLIITVQTGVDKIVFDCGSNSGVICKNKNKQEIEEIIINRTNQRYEEEMVISLSEDFKDNSGDVFIKVWAVGGRNNDGSEKRTLAGKICVVKKYPKQVEIVLVPINVKLDNVFVFPFPKFLTCRDQLTSLYSSKITIEKEKSYLSKFLAQAQIVPKITEKKFKDESAVNKIIREHKSFSFFFDSIDVSKDVNGQNIVSRLEKQFEQDHPEDSSKYKVFILNVKSRGGVVGRCDEISSKSALICEGADITTLCHEISHCFGLWHSFSNHSDYTFSKWRTSNIMDYSGFLKGVTFWEWQWKYINENAVGEYLDEQDAYCI